MRSFWIAEKPLVLASKSQSRQTLLRAAGIPFEAAPAEIDERAVEASIQPPEGASIARHLAQAKALSVAKHYPGRLVLGADQTLALGADIFSKPATLPAAETQLGRLSGRTHILHSAICLAQDEQVLFEAAPQARMTMRELSPDFIALYAATAGPAILSSVGAYQLEGLGVHLFEKIEGDHSTILGLPLIDLLAFLRRHGSLAS
jgi:septum formation protein